jgi:diadenosine tetraphosphate (Ap4A) HIT family hydrolase
VSSSECPACCGDWPSEEDRIADLSGSRVYLHADQFFPGWTILVWRRHVTELFDLSPGDRARLIEEVSRIAAAVTAVFRPVKVNYGLLGNQLPHMHWHVIPRLADDPAPREAAWGISHAPVSLDDAARRDRIARIRAQLSG